MLFDERLGVRHSTTLNRALACAMLLGLGACEPTAFISPNVHNFQSVESTGAIGQECTAISPEHEPLLRFTLRDSNNEPIEPGTELRGFTVELGASFTTADLAIVDSRGVLFPAPDIVCEDRTIGAACPDPGLAASGFTCQLIDDSAVQTGDDLTPVVCALTEVAVEINPNTPLRYLGQETQRSAVILLMANGSSLLGIGPDGVPDRLRFSSDPFDRRTRAANLFLRQLGSENSSYAGSTELCVATFVGQGEPRYYSPEGEDVSECFQRVRVGSAGFDDLESAINNVGISETDSPRNHWGALRDAATRFDTWAPTADSRHIVLFTDGDVSADAVETAEALRDYENALAAIETFGVTVHVAQLDNPPEGQTRTQPIDALSTLACATGGNYTYVESPDDLSEFFTNLGLAIPAHYETELTVTRVVTLPVGSYKLSLTLRVTVDDRSEAYTFGGSQVTSAGREDLRISVFNRGDCLTADRGCLVGRECPPDADGTVSCLAEPPTTDPGDPGEGSGEAPEGSGEGG